jgi:hypothetical protein
MKQIWLSLLTVGIFMVFPIVAVAASTDDGSTVPTPPVLQLGRHPLDQDNMRQLCDPPRDGLAVPANGATQVGPDTSLDGDYDLLHDLEQELAGDQLDHLDPDSDSVLGKPW